MGIRAVRYALLVVAVAMALAMFQWRGAVPPTSLSLQRSVAPAAQEENDGAAESDPPARATSDRLEEDRPPDDNDGQSPDQQPTNATAAGAATRWPMNTIRCNETIDVSYNDADPTVPRRSLAGVPRHWDVNSSHANLYDLAMQAPVGVSDDDVAQARAIGESGRSEVLRTFVEVRRRSLHAALFRLQGLLAAGTGDGRSNSRPITVQWTRCALLRLWMASGEHQTLTRLATNDAATLTSRGGRSGNRPSSDNDKRILDNERCYPSWAAEVEQAPCASSMGGPFEQLLECLRERTTTTDGKSDGPRCASPHQSAAVASLLRKYYLPTADGSLLRTHVAQSRVLPRRLQAVPPQNEDEAIVASFLSSRDWTPPCNRSAASVGCGAIHSVQFPSMPKSIVGGRDATCLDPYSRFHLLQGEVVSPRQWRQLRVLVRMDVEDALEALQTTNHGASRGANERRQQTPQGDPPGQRHPQEQREAIDPATAPADEHCSRVVPWNRLTAMMRRSRWLFDQFVPPFFNESEAFVSAANVAVPPVPMADDAGGGAPPGEGNNTEGGAPPGGTTSTRAQPPSGGDGGGGDSSGRFGVVASRAVLHRVGSYKLSQLLAPLHYELANVCLSPHGYGLSGFGGSSFIPPELRDERRTKIRTIAVRRRYTPPQHYVDRPLFLSAVQYQSDNLGHVLYRLGAQQNLLRRAWSSTANAMRVPPDGNPDDYLVGYLVIPNALETFGLTNSLRHFYQLFNQSWFSVAQMRGPNEQPSAEEEADEICFRRAWIGHDALYMYHSVGSSPPMRKRYLASAVGSQAKVEQYFGFLRDRVQQCVVAPLQQLLRTADDRLHSDANNNTALVVPSSSPRGGPSWHRGGGGDSVAQRLLQQSVTSIGMPTHALHHAAVPIRVLVIQRRQRRIGNLNQLLAALALRYGEVQHDDVNGGNSDGGHHHDEARNYSTAGRPSEGASFTLRDKAFSKRAMVVTVVDMQDMLMAEQAALVAATDVLVGVHGTALQWMLLMRRGSVVVEFQYPSQGCVSSGVFGDGSNPGSRLFCEFGKTSMATHITHVAFMSADLFGDGARHRLNVVLKRSAFLAVVDAALCSLHVGVDRSSRYCWRLFPHFASSEPTA